MECWHHGHKFGYLGTGDGEPIFAIILAAWNFSSGAQLVGGMPKNYLIVPCYNEALRLPVDEFERLAEKSGACLIFVDDGSTDGTASILKDFAATLGDQGYFIAQETNLGKGEAVRFGMNFALGLDAEIIGFVDADMPTSVPEICRLLDIAVRNEYLVVLGARIKML